MVQLCERSSTTASHWSPSLCQNPVLCCSWKFVRKILRHCSPANNNYQTKQDQCPLRKFLICYKLFFFILPFHENTTCNQKWFSSNIMLSFYFLPGCRSCRTFRPFHPPVGYILIPGSNPAKTNQSVKRNKNSIVIWLEVCRSLISLHLL